MLLGLGFDTAIGTTPGVPAVSAGAVYRCALASPSALVATPTGPSMPSSSW